MKRILLVRLAGALILASSLSLAQRQHETPPPPDGGTRQVLVSILIPSLANAPFSATVNTEWIRQLGDGTTITLKNHRSIARDSAGRIFQERRLLVPDDGKHESPVTQIEISDPASHKLYICMPQELICQLEVFFPISSGPAPAAANEPREPKSGSPEDLGRQFIGGFETKGTRETVVIETGAIGNDHPLLTRREFWYSAQLGVNIISKRQDPQFGTQNFELTNIVPGEPDAKLFEVPGGFKVIDLRKPRVFSTPPDPSSN